MKELNLNEVNAVSGGHEGEYGLGVAVGTGIGAAISGAGYVLGGGAGRDFGIWLYEKLR